MGKPSSLRNQRVHPSLPFRPGGRSARGVDFFFFLFFFSLDRAKQDTREDHDLVADSRRWVQLLRNCLCESVNPRPASAK